MINWIATACGLMKQLAIPLGEQTTLTKWLVIAMTCLLMPRGTWREARMRRDIPEFFRRHAFSREQRVAGAANAAWQPRGIALPFAVLPSAQAFSHEERGERHVAGSNPEFFRRHCAQREAIQRFFAVVASNAKQSRGFALDDQLDCHGLRPDETTSHSTRRANYAHQVAGYRNDVPVECRKTVVASRECGAAIRSSIDEELRIISAG